MCAEGNSGYLEVQKEYLQNWTYDGVTIIYE